MKSLSILFAVPTLMLTILGCGLEQSSQQPPASQPAITRELVTQQEIEEWGKNLTQHEVEERVENLLKDDSVLATHPGLSDLLTAARDERDSEGRLVAISLYEKNVTLADLTESTSLQRLYAGHIELTDEDLSFLPKLTGLEVLDFNVNPGITDAGLRHLQGLVKLRFLSLFYCPQLTGTGFAELSELDNLVILNIGNNKNITDDSLKYLQELESLQVLLADPLWGVTDTGLKHIAKIRNLRRLIFASKLITDQGLEYLADLKNLETLSLEGCEKLTDKGIQRLQQALPGCRIVH